MVSKSKAFLFVLIGFIGGIALRSFINSAPQGGVLALGTAALLWSLKNNKTNTLIFGFFVLAFSFGLWRASSAFEPANQELIQKISGKETVIIGEIAAEPDARTDFSYITLEPIEKALKGKILVKTGLYPEYFYGDVLKIKGRIEAPENFSDFDWENYLAKSGVFSISKYPEITLVKRPAEKDFYSLLISFKHAFVNRIGKILSEPQAAFLSALLLGARRSLPPDLVDSFNKTGTSHIVAISGYNISLIAYIIFNFLGFIFIPRRFVFWLVGASILIFTLITGAEASVVRAAIMGSLLMLSRHEGRFYNIGNAVALAGAAMIFVNPYLLRYDSGFKLSFLATLGVAYLSPVFEKLFKKVPETLSLRSNLSATLSAQIFALPVILSFGRFSFVSLPANVLILPAVPWTMALGFFSVLISFVSVKMGVFSALPVWFLLSYQMWVAKILSLFIG